MFSCSLAYLQCAAPPTCSAWPRPQARQTVPALFPAAHIFQFLSILSSKSTFSMPILYSGSEMTLPTALCDQWSESLLVSASHCSFASNAAFKAALCHKQPTTPTSQLVLIMITDSHGRITLFSFRMLEKTWTGGCSLHFVEYHSCTLPFNECQ